ncbi:HlyD family secretion protein [Acinetobacter larvae]|uniref:HlyD family secretion protein n=1 Tax=Acinetobacter larvae TaxID=1789224 RepID=A0A1B2LWD3_9GAMM|nr:HlyD family secretion protein [Acinetobacter larvae]AOA57199.1 hypothetical protein BFG52_01745 [Acinetobacter larvae]
MSDQDPANSIFRKEALQANRSRWHAKALLVSDLPSTAFAVFAVLVLCVLILFVVFGQFSRRVNVQGEVVSFPQPVNVTAPQAGHIIKLAHNTGQSVAAGDVLMHLDVSRNSTAGNISHASVDSIRQQISDHQAMMGLLEHNKQRSLVAMQQQLAQYRQVHQRGIQRFYAAQVGLKEMQDIAKDYAQYLKQGLVNREQVNNLRHLSYERQTAVENISAQLLQYVLEINELEKKIQTVVSDFDRQILEQQVQAKALQRQLAEIAATDILVVKAPRAGYIENIIASVGQVVQAGDALLQLSAGSKAPHRTFSVVLWLPNSVLPYIRVGDPVNLRYDAFPYEKFGQFQAVIQQVSKVPASSNELAKYASAPKDQQVALYKIQIQPRHKHIEWQGQTLQLHAGMQVQAILFLEKRPLYQWVFSPFYSLSQRIAGADT